METGADKCRYILNPFKPKKRRPEKETETNTNSSGSRIALLKSKLPAALKIVANQQGLFNIMSLAKQRKTSYATNNLNYQLGF